MGADGEVEVLSQLVSSWSFTFVRAGGWGAVSSGLKSALLWAMARQESVEKQQHGFLKVARETPDNRGAQKRVARSRRPRTPNASTLAFVPLNAADGHEATSHLTAWLSGNCLQPETPSAVALGRDALSQNGYGSTSVCNTPKFAFKAKTPRRIRKPPQANSAWGGGSCAQLTPSARLENCQQHPREDVVICLGPHVGPHQFEACLMALMLNASLNRLDPMGLLVLSSICSRTRSD